MTNTEFMHESAPLGDDRFEVKFVGNIWAFDVLETWVRMHRAGFVEPYPPRSVNNVYFDTPTLGAYEENLVGASMREKVRLRWYGEGDGFAEKGTLEVKLRKNKLGWKLSYPIAQMPTSSDSWFKIQALVRDQLPEDARVHFDVHPTATLINRYRRRYYLSRDDRIRMTIDTDLRAFDQRYSGTPDFQRSIAMPPILVVEFKFAPEDRDHAIEAIRGIPLRVSRSSKYAMACAMMTAT